MYRGRCDEECFCWRSLVRFSWNCVKVPMVNLKIAQFSASNRCATGNFRLIQDARVNSFGSCSSRGGWSVGDLERQRGQGVHNGKVRWMDGRGKPGWGEFCILGWPGFSGAGKRWKIRGAGPSDRRSPGRRPTPQKISNYLLCYSGRSKHVYDECQDTSKKEKVPFKIIAIVWNCLRSQY